MFFEDIFYPDNPKRREQVRAYQAALCNALTTYQSAWNSLVDEINPMFATIPNEKYNKIRLQKLDYNVSESEVTTCVKLINSVAQATKSQIEKLFQDIGLPPLPDTKDIEAKKDIAGNLHFYISQLPTLIIDTAVAVALTAIIAGLVGFLAVVAALSATAVFITTALGSLLLGGVAFILADMAVSAISGAIERNSLNEAIEAYSKIDTEVTQRLIEARTKILGIVNCFQEGIFKISDDILLKRKKDGSWVILPV